MSLTKQIATLWNAKFWDAVGCGETEAQAARIADSATASLRATLKRVERAQGPQLPRHSNLAGRRQAATR